MIVTPSRKGLPALKANVRYDVLFFYEFQYQLLALITKYEAIQLPKEKIDYSSLC